MIIGIVAVGPSYIARTRTLIEQLVPLGYNFIVLTDSPQSFKSNKVTVVEYTRPIFSFQDKRIIFEEGFKLSNTVLLLDADHICRSAFTIESVVLEPGIYPQILWKHPADCSFENFIAGLTPRVPYGVEYKAYCDRLGLVTDGVVLVQESFLVIKKHDKIDLFLQIWKDLASFCELKDMQRHQGVLGYGEGYSIGVAAKNSGLMVIENHGFMQQFTRHLAHLAWEPQ